MRQQITRGRYSRKITESYIPLNTQTIMAKDNPIDVYRRQQRKKEVKKNKTARIKSRDAKVAATRSLEEVK